MAHIIESFIVAHSVQSSTDPFFLSFPFPSLSLSPSASSSLSALLFPSFIHLSSFYLSTYISPSLLLLILCNPLLLSSLQFWARSLAPIISRQSTPAPFLYSLFPLLDIPFESVFSCSTSISILPSCLLSLTPFFIPISLHTQTRVLSYIPISHAHTLQAHRKKNDALPSTSQQHRLKTTTFHLDVQNIRSVSHLSPPYLNRQTRFQFLISLSHLFSLPLSRPTSFIHSTQTQDTACMADCWSIISPRLESLLGWCNERACYGEGAREKGENGEKGNMGVRRDKHDFTFCLGSWSKKISFRRRGERNEKGVWVIGSVWEVWWHTTIHACAFA